MAYIGIGWKCKTKFRSTSILYWMSNTEATISPSTSCRFTLCLARFGSRFHFTPVQSGHVNSLLIFRWMKQFSTFGGIHSVADKLFETAKAQLIIVHIGWSIKNKWIFFVLRFPLSVCIFLFWIRCTDRTHQPSSSKDQQNTRSS